MRKPSSPIARKGVWIAVIALTVLHQDLWLWNTAEPLLFGFIPVGLAYHAGYSIAAAVVWGLAVLYAWPTELEAFAEERISSPPEKESQTP